MRGPLNRGHLKIPVTIMPRTTKDADLQVAFWAEVKLRLVKKYHTIQGAFRELDRTRGSTIANVYIYVSILF